MAFDIFGEPVNPDAPRLAGNETRLKHDAHVAQRALWLAYLAYAAQMRDAGLTPPAFTGTYTRGLES